MGLVAATVAVALAAAVAALLIFRLAEHRLAERRALVPNTDHRRVRRARR